MVLGWQSGAWIAAGLFALSPVALAIVLGYSYTKRFTMLSHVVLGLSLAIAPVGAWLAIRARRSDERWRNLLPEILERETAFLGLAAPCTRVIVCAQGTYTFDAAMLENWRSDSLSYRELTLATEPH